MADNIPVQMKESVSFCLYKLRSVFHCGRVYQSEEFPRTGYVVPGHDGAGPGRVQVRNLVWIFAPVWKAMRIFAPEWKAMRIFAKYTFKDRAMQV